MYERVFAATFGNVAKHHGQIEESMLVAQLRTERAGIVPEARVLDADFALAPRETSHWNLNTPGLLVEAAHGEGVASSVGGAEVADAIGEIANLVERVPCRHLHHDAALQ